LGGMPPGRYKVYDREIEMLPSGRIVIPGSPNLAGSASNLLECTANVIRMAGLSHADGWRLASTNPASLMRLDDRLGIAPGKEATLTVYECPDSVDGARFDVLETWVAGTKVFDARTSERAVLPDAPLDASMPI
ncbi:MAG: amidohydrolase family protein, partial [Gemmatimonadetes bacterium]|nr:amidohydrolase family protein [Gemmatimonadota bacterium]